MENTNEEVKEDVKKEEVTKMVPTPEAHIEELKEDLLPISTLHGIVNALHKSIMDAHEIVGSYQKRSNTVDEREKNVLAREFGMDQKDKLLRAREEAVRGIENTIQLQKSAQELMDSAQLRLNAAVESEINLRKVTDEQKQLMASERQQTQLEANNLITQRNALEVEVSRRVNDTLVKLGIVKTTPVPVEAPVPVEENKG